MEPRPRDTRTDRLSPEGLATGRALVIEPAVRKAEARAAPFERDPAARLDEAIGLARAIDLDVADSGIVMLTAVRPATYLGTGESAQSITTIPASWVLTSPAISSTLPVPR